MAKYSILLIGCGNIGALYDLDSRDDRVRTHARAFNSLKDQFEMTVSDVDWRKADLVQKKYNCKTVSYDAIDYSKYQVICLATPTNEHFRTLEILLNQNTPLIICEKPISLSGEELIQLEHLKESSQSKILVNYIRRFSPDYTKLKSFSDQKNSWQNLKNVNIKYCRGFLNNCSHALDLINFLFDQDLALQNLIIQTLDYDKFEKDPTISASFTEHDKLFQLTGFVGISYFIFEIELFFTDMKIELLNNGNTIRVHEYQSENGTFSLNSEFRSNNILHQCMLDVVNYGTKILENGFNDNFNSALSLNRNMINALNKKHNVK